MTYFVSIYQTNPRCVYYFECRNCGVQIDPHRNPYHGACDTCIEDSNSVYWDMVRPDLESYDDDHI